jgi:hypothetical protein
MYDRESKIKELVKLVNSQNQSSTQNIKKGQIDDSN